MVSPPTPYGWGKGSEDGVPPVDGRRYRNKGVQNPGFQDDLETLPPRMGSTLRVLGDSSALGRQTNPSRGPLSRLSSSTCVPRRSSVVPRATHPDPPLRSPTSSGVSGSFGCPIGPNLRGSRRRGVPGEDMSPDRPPTTSGDHPSWSGRVGVPGEGNNIPGDGSHMSLVITDPESRRNPVGRLPGDETRPVSINKTSFVPNLPRSTPVPLRRV